MQYIYFLLLLLLLFLFENKHAVKGRKDMIKKETSIQRLYT